MKKTAFIASSFGWGAGLVAIIVGIIEKDYFVAYIGIVCFVSSILNIAQYLKELKEQ